ncbi:hypothetical protein NEMIN01_2005 [Nematocida minor]|uniref:uncharacterized protein n=1 Tax=Nematocida minor TaxID=1912983 RepID=UPI00221F5D53|nr:uncharacterized protein NEMIN01_2005 [Nematocida minor]KAI5192418.1 hypothetical protein NEMIN01_2005 [Nematocida minor]
MFQKKKKLTNWKRKKDKSILLIIEMEQRDKVILWLAHDEIQSMSEYVEELKNEGVPSYSKISVWGLAFTKSWYRRIERPQFAIYNTIIKCTKKLPCPDCYRKKEQKKAELEEAAKKGKGVQGAVDAVSKALSPGKAQDGSKEDKPDKNAEEKDSKEPKEDGKDKNSEVPESEHSEEEGEEHSILDDEEIESLVSHLDCDFAKEENKCKTEGERYYTIRMVMHALKKSYEYNMLVSHKRVHPKNIDKIFSLCIGAFSYFTSYNIEKIFKVFFFLASNLNGVFATKKGQDMTQKEFDKFLLFVQNTAALSKNKFMILIDAISSLNQEILTKFAYDIIKGNISVTGVQKELFDKYSKPSAAEIDEFKKTHPFSLLSTFTPRIIFLHQKENKTLDELKKENAYLKENIEVLLSDLKHSNTSGFAAQLKKDLEEKNEQIKKLQDK